MICLLPFTVIHVISEISSHDDPPKGAWLHFKPFALNVSPLLSVPSHLLPEGPEKNKNECTTLKQKPVQNVVGKRSKQTIAVPCVRMFE